MLQVISYYLMQWVLPCWFIMLQIKKVLRAHNADWAPGTVKPASIEFCLVPSMLISRWYMIKQSLLDEKSIFGLFDDKVRWD